MSINNEKKKGFEKLYDISSLDSPVNLETKDGILPNRKLQILYFNLIWNVELKLPKLDGIKSLIVLLEYFYNKFNEITKTSPNLISRKYEVYYILIKELLNIEIEKLDSSSWKSLGQYFFDKDFFTCFLLTLNKLNNKNFFRKFISFSKVSINIK